MASESKVLDMQMPVCKKNLVQNGNIYCPDFEYVRFVVFQGQEHPKMSQILALFAIDIIPMISFI